MEGKVGGAEFMTRKRWRWKKGREEDEGTPEIKKKKEVVDGGAEGVEMKTMQRRSRWRGWWKSPYRGWRGAADTWGPLYGDQSHYTPVHVYSSSVTSVAGLLISLSPR